MRQTILAFLVAFLFASNAFAGPTELDRAIAADNAGKTLTAAPVIDDLAFLRRVSVDLIGRIPNTKEINEYLAWSDSDRRGKVVDKLLKDDRFTDRMTVFFADMLRIRSGNTGGSALLAFVHQAVKDGLPYDEMVRRMISANGKAGRTPELGFILGDDVDPLALAGSTAQTFLGLRIACAQCHDHPFDDWTREQFYGFAAYFGKTQRVESRFNRSIYTTEGHENKIMWPPAGPGVTNRKPVKAEFLYQIDKKGMEPFVARLTALRKAQADKAAGVANKNTSVDDVLAAADSKVGSATGAKRPATFDVAGQAQNDIKKIDVEGDLYRKSVLRHELAASITDPYNRYFSWALANRMFHELVGRGFVMPVDDFKPDNKPSHPTALNHLSNEFVASGFDIRQLVRLIVTSETYQRGHLVNSDEAVRQAGEAALVATPMRRMISEALFDSIVEAGHLWKEKWPDGANKRTVRQMVQVRVDEAGKIVRPTPAAKGKNKGGDDDKMMAGGNMMASGMKVMGGGYNLEQSIEVDFSKVLAEAMKEDEPKIEMSEVLSPEDIEARRMVMEKQDQPRARYMTKYVDVTVDYNPKFNTSLRMESPAPRPHFLRVFGQPAREALGEERDTLPSMRQALMMLNGSLTHEASRVGPLEPMHALVAGPRADLNKAIQYAYREIMTREPSADEIAFAKEVITGGTTPTEGMADLRWALLNSNEFRYIP